MNRTTPAERRGRRRRPGTEGCWWTAALVFLGVVASAPLVFVVGALVSPSVEVWGHLWRTRLPEMLADTAVLVVAVAVGGALLGVSLAWLVTAYRFPGRDVFSWMLALPLAIPGYVLGFVFLSTVGPTGSLQRWWRGLFGADAWFPEVRSMLGVVSVLTLVLYPYVYLLCRASFAGSSAASFEVARTLGHGRVRAFLEVVLPISRPAVAAGVTLVVMETLTDFATVQYFGVETISVGIYRVWRGQYDRDAAAELAGLVMALALLVVLAERVLRGRARYAEPPSVRAQLEPVLLRGWKAALATLTCGSVLFLAFGAPVGRLLAWAVAETDASDLDRFAGYLRNTLWLSAVTALMCVGAGLLVANALRFSTGRSARVAARATLVGYAVPAPVVAIGVLLLLSSIDDALDGSGVRWSLLAVSGSVTAVAYGYLVRFAAVGVSAVESNFERIPSEVTMSARVLGLRPLRVATRVHLPLARAAIASAAGIVAMEAIKELPIVLLLRPFGFDTLSVWTWQLAGESLFRQAALPALSIVATSLVAVFLLTRSMEGGASSRSHVEPASAAGAQAGVPVGERAVA